jgi:hypothetical protein
VDREFKQCLENKKIVSFARGKNLVKKELSVAKSELSDAKAAMKMDAISGLLYKPTMPCSMSPERLSTPKATVKRATTYRYQVLTTIILCVI